MQALFLWWSDQLKQPSRSAKISIRSSGLQKQWAYNRVASLLNTLLDIVDLLPNSRSLLLMNKV